MTFIDEVVLMNIPKGYKIVPCEPTREMCLAAKKERETYPLSFDANSPVVTYRAMLLSAPTVELPAYDEAKERELFELNHDVPDGVYFSKEKNEYRSMNMRGFEILACEDLTTKFKGWLACAKSRARSAE